MKIELEKKCLEAVFTPWQIEIIKILGTGNPYTSQTLTVAVNTELEHPISRASVIGFMKQLYAQNLIDVVEGTKKGGTYSTYSSKYTPKDFLRQIILKVRNWILVTEHDCLEVSQ